MSRSGGQVRKEVKVATGAGGVSNFVVSSFLCRALAGAEGWSRNIDRRGSTTKMRGNYFCERIRVGTQKRDPQPSIINLVIPAF